MKTTKTSLLLLCAYFSIAFSRDLSRDGPEFTWVRHDQDAKYQIVECGAEVTLAFIPFDHPRGVWVEEKETCHLSFVRDSDPINERDSQPIDERNFEFEPVLKTLTCKRFIFRIPSPSEVITDFLVACIPE
jgi:hypothetical protein